MLKKNSATRMLLVLLGVKLVVAFSFVLFLFTVFDRMIYHKLIKFFFIYGSTSIIVTLTNSLGLLFCISLILFSYVHNYLDEFKHKRLLRQKLRVANFINLTFVSMFLFLLLLVSAFATHFTQSSLWLFTYLVLFLTLLSYLILLLIILINLLKER